MQIFENKKHNKNSVAISQLKVKSTNEMRQSSQKAKQILNLVNKIYQPNHKQDTYLSQKHQTHAAHNRQKKSENLKFNSPL